MNILETITQSDIRSIRPVIDDRQPWDFTINWMVGKYCNYVCSYCDKSNRDKTSPHLSLDDLKTYWTNAKTAATDKGFKKLRVILTGGEPTANPNFLEFLEYLDQERKTLDYLNVAFITNISQSKDYYLKALDYSHVSFSTHFEYWSEHEAMDTILSCNKYVKNNRTVGKINVMLMLEEAYKNQVEKIKNIFDQEDIRYTVQRIRNTYLAKGIQNKHYKEFDYQLWKQENGQV
jgi:MoaA/NifB/PqqE/SkfB family radical SAM enzyme